ncbi:MAG: VacB/RNase II family 3'-5' exoribonuclease [Elusimicrobiota bacterium]
MGQQNTCRGVLQHRGNFAFLLVDEPGERDIFVRGPSLRLAMDGDTVEVRRRGGGGRPEGEIVRVLHRSRSTVVGVLRTLSGKWWLESTDQEDAPWIEVAGFDAVHPQAGMLAAARITRWPTPSVGAAGQVTELLGRPGEPGARTRAIVRALEIPERFPEAVLREARTFPGSVTAAMSRGRLDLRATPLFTIDGADAKDFDDAVSLQRLDRGVVRLGVHIADVSSYVLPGSEIDREAARRGTSVYLPGRVIPMLPPNLSDNLCSLMPEVDRLAFSCFMDIDDAGRVVDRKFVQSVIRSWRRFTYEEVETLLQGATVRGVRGPVKDAVLAMGRLAKRLTQSRLQRGALDIDLPEYAVEVSSSGAPTAIIRRERLDSHRLIEEFMILANEAVAVHLRGLGRVFPNRIHEDPDPEKLAALREELQTLGVNVAGGLATAGSRGLQNVLKTIRNHPLRDILGVMVMRSLKQAVYSVRNLGHFGLASKAYCHFTSPIRRYPDLLTHRELQASLKPDAANRRGKSRGRGRKGRARGQTHEYEQLCVHASQRERNAAEAERQVTKVLRGEFMGRQVGQEFDGVVMRAAPYGVFVELVGTGVSGLARSAKTRIGTPVRVRIQGVLEAKGEISLEILRSGLKKAAPRPAGKKAGKNTRNKWKRGKK